MRGRLRAGTAPRDRVDDHTRFGLPALRAWWRKWKPWTADYEGRAFWIGVGSVMDLTGHGTRESLRQLHADRRRDRQRRWTR